MNAALNVKGDSERYDDGLETDYTAAIRMWNAIDKSVRAFDRRCGFITLRAGREILFNNSVKDPSTGNNS